MISIYITGFIITFLFVLLEQADDDSRNDINGVPIKMDWGNALFVCSVFSIFWPITLIGVIISIKQSI